MLGILEQLLRRPHLDDAAEIHDRDPTAEMAHHAQVMGDEEQGQPHLALQPGEEIEDLGLDRDIQGRDRLIGDDQLRPHGQRPSDADPLALAAGELGAAPAGEFPRQADPLHQLRHMARQLALRAQAMDRKHLPQGLGDGEARVERGEGILEDHLGPAAEGQQILRRQAQHILAGEAHLAARRRGQAQDGTAERALAAAALAHQAEGIALLDGEADAIDRAGDPRRPAPMKSPRPLGARYWT